MRSGDWLRCRSMEDVYETQRRTEEAIRRFLDPLHGGFDGRGWKIGALPGTPQLLAVDNSLKNVPENYIFTDEFRGWGNGKPFQFYIEQ